MNGLPYYKAYPRDFFEGTVGFSFELKAAYRLVLDLIYQHGGALPDDARHIAGQLGCSVRAWNSYKAALIDAGKISADLGIISNFRADKELESLGSFREKQRQNASKPRKNKGLTAAVALPKGSHTDTDTDKAAAVSKEGAAAAAFLPYFGEWKRRVIDAISAITGTAFEGSDDAEIDVWMAAGVSMDQCITIAGKVARREVAKDGAWRPNSLAYFTPAIMEHARHKDRVRAEPASPAEADIGVLQFWADMVKGDAPIHGGVSPKMQKALLDAGLVTPQRMKERCG